MARRTTKDTRRTLPTTRALVGRAGYFPVKTGHKRGVPQLSGGTKITVPAGWLGTAPEWAIFQAALTLGLKEHTDFEYEYLIPGAGLGIDAKVDFYFFTHMVVEAQGLYWHYGFGGFAQQNDQIRKQRLEAVGYPVVFIDEDDLIGPRADPVYYLKEALAGRDYSRSATGSI